MSLKSKSKSSSDNSKPSTHKAFQLKSLPTNNNLLLIDHMWRLKNAAEKELGMQISMNLLLKDTNLLEKIIKEAMESQNQALLSLAHETMALFYEFTKAPKNETRHLHTERRGPNRLKLNTSSAVPSRTTVSKSLKTMGLAVIGLIGLLTLTALALYSLNPTHL